MTESPRAVVHVVQSNDEESFIFEYDKEGKLDSNTVQFMLVGGGPSRPGHHYAPPEIGRPNNKLFALLNWLSGEHPQNKPANGLLREINTLILTLDDGNQRNVIRQLLSSLLPKNGQSSNYGNKWLQGERKVAAGQAPIQHIWYNSLHDISVLQDKSVQLDWFDQQLQQYAAMNLQPRLGSFNDDLANANLKDSKAPNQVAYAMKNATAKDSQGNAVTRGQFEFTFLGPSSNNLMSNDLLTNTSGSKMAGNLTRTPGKTSVVNNQSSFQGPNSNSAVVELMDNLETKINRSTKDLSSISFSAVDNQHQKSMIILVDGTATALYQDFIANRREARHFTLMKVAHHGDPHYNCWPRDQMRKNEESGLSSGKSIDDTSALQRDVIFFFAKVQADKFLISADSSNDQLLSLTIIGIISAANETGRHVEIYFINPPGLQLLNTVGLFLQHNHIPTTVFQVYLLVQGIDWGTISLYDHELDVGWEKLESQKDLGTTFSTWVKNQFPVLTEVQFKNSAIPPQSTNGTHTPPVMPMVGKPPAPALPQILDALKSQSTPKISARRQSVVRENAVHEELTRPKPAATRTISDVHSLLQYLIEEGALTQVQVSQFEQEASNGGDFNLAAFVCLFLGSQETETFLSSLPCDLPDTFDCLTMDSSPSHWLIQDFTAEVVDPPSPDLRSWRGIYSLSFTLAPTEADPLLWRLPFGVASPAQNSSEYIITHDSPISVSIIWPAYSTRQISGTFRGILRSSPMELNIVGSFDATRYSILFSDINYATDDHTVAMGDILRFFNCNDFNFGRRLNDLLIPRRLNASTQQLISQLRDQLEQTNEARPLRNGGFVLEKVLSKVVLKEISATLRFEQDQQWPSFQSLHLPLQISGLNFVLNEMESTRQHELTLQLTGNIIHQSDKGELDTSVPFQIYAGTSMQGYVYELSILPEEDQPLSLQKVLEIIGLSSSLDLRTDCPGVSNLSNAVTIKQVVVGWGGSALPDYIKFTTHIDDWNILEDKFLIRQIALEVHVGGLSSGSGVQLLLQGQGTLAILTADVNVHFDIIRGFSEADDLVTFRAESGETSLSLGDVLLHFIGEDQAVTGPGFNGLQQKRAVDHFFVEACRNGASWSLSKFYLEMGIEGKLNIVEQMNGSHPMLLVDADYPFDKSRRKVFIAVNTTLHISEVPCRAQIVLASSETSRLTTAFTSDGQPLTLRAVGSQFSTDFRDLSLPPNVSFLTDLAIRRAMLDMELANKSVSVSAMLVDVVSTSSLQLWNEVTLEDVSLAFSYSKLTGKQAQLTANLYFSPASDPLQFSLEYESTPSPPVGAVARNDLGKTPGGVAWEAKASYDGTISVLDILKKVSGIDLRECLQSVELSALREVIDIKISNLRISLTRNPKTTSFFFEADTDWLFFSHIRFACTKSETGWSYSFGFSVQDVDKFIKTTPVLAAIASATELSIKDPSLVVFDGPLDGQAIPPTLQLSKKINRAGINVAFAMRIQFLGSLRGLEKVTGTPSLDIIGIVSNSYIRLSAGLEPIRLLKGKMILSGVVVVTCSKETNMAPRIGVEGTAVLDFGKRISKTPIETSIALLVDTNTAALGFQFTVDKWEAVFGYDGLNFENICFQASFPPEQFPVPSILTIAGTVNLVVGSASFGGSVNIHGAETDPFDSYATGNIAGLDLNNIIRAFSEAKTVPEHLNPGFGPLEFQIVPRDLVDVNGNSLKQQCVMRGSMRIPQAGFDANVQLGITMSTVLVEGHLAPIIAFDKQLFSILASSHEDPPPPPGTGATVHVAVSDQTIPEIRISGQVTFMGMTNEVYLDISEEGLMFVLDRTFAVGGSLTGSFNSRHLTISASLKAYLELFIPSFKVGAVVFRDIRIIDFQASLQVEVVWSAMAWPLHVSGHFTIFELVMEKQFISSAEIQDFASLTHEISSQIQSTFTDDFVNVVKKLLDELNKVVTTLKQMQLSPRDIADFLVNSCGAALSAVIKALRESLQLGWEDLVSVVQSVGETASNAAASLKELGCDPYQIASAIAHVFGSNYKVFCGDLLIQAGYPVEDIARFFRDVFHESTLGVITLLGSLGFGPISAAKAVSVLFGISETKAMILILPIIVPVTEMQVVVAVAKLLLTGAGKLHEYAATSSKPLPHNPSTRDIESELNEMLAQGSKGAFKAKFGYDYLGSQSVPPSAVAAATIRTTEKKCSYTDGDLQRVAKFVDDVLGDMQLESWAEGPAKNALLEQARTLAQLPVSDEWQMQPFSAVYNHPNGVKSIQTEAIFFCINGGIFQNGKRVTQTVISYTGVYYDTLSPLQQARKQLIGASYEKAITLVNEHSLVSSDIDLTTVLEKYTSTIFEEEHRYLYGGWPRELLKTTKNIIDVRFSALGFFENKNTDSIGRFVGDKLLSGASLPALLADKARADIIELCQDLVTMMGTLGEWTRMNYEREYEGIEGVCGPTKCTAVILRSSDTKTVDEKSTISTTYLFFNGAFYETPPTESIVYSDMVRGLYQGVLGNMVTKPDQILEPTPQSLDTLLSQYAAIKFNEEFKYAYSGDATKPPDCIAEEPVCGIQAFRAFPQIVRSDLDQWVEGNMLRNKANIFNEASVRDTLLTQLKSFLAEKTGASISDDWKVSFISETYQHPTDDGKSLKTAAVVLSTNKLLNKKDSRSKTCFLYYMGIYYVINNADRSVPGRPSKMSAFFSKLGSKIKSKRMSSG